MNQYDQIKYIGKGSYGEVYLVVDNNTNKKYAMKVIQKNEKQEQYEKLRQEGEILQQLNHKNIIKLEQMQENQDKIFLIMDYIENGNLTKLIKEKNQESEYFSEIQISQIIKGLLRGLKYIHDKNIIHRDLKTDNILIQDKNDLESVKIIDFGLCIQFQKENNIKYSSKYCGTQLYMAPELFQHKIYSRPVDIYSIGIIMYMLINKGQHPFYKDNDSFDSFQQKVINQNWNLSNMSNLRFILKTNLF